jgi:hypothetical protein
MIVNGYRVDPTGVYGVNTVDLSVSGHGDWWYLDLAAPAGQTLQPGTYTDATAYPNDGTHPGLRLVGNGGACNMLPSSFTVTDAVFGPYGYVQTFDATFEQHCDGVQSPIRGEVHIANPPPPQALELGVTVATDGKADTLNGNATVHGTVSCTTASNVSVGGAITQVVKRALVRGWYSTSAACAPGAPVAWTATAVPRGTTPFQKGDAEVGSRRTGWTRRTTKR